ncbi:hypothetical protein A3732_12635 [Oleiphilus sp. HI0050]|nr:hypothetical protein A3732_12635 [Oleiphilus sp. HI0050]
MALVGQFWVQINRLASRATGGDFLQGAMTAAMVHLFNELTTRVMDDDTRQLYVKEIKGFTANDLLVAGHKAYGMTFDQDGINELAEYIPSVNDPEDAYLPKGIRRDYIRVRLLGRGGFLSMIRADYNVLALSEIPNVLEQVYDIFTGVTALERASAFIDFTNSTIDATTFNDHKSEDVFRFYSKQHNLREP